MIRKLWRLFRSTGEWPISEPLGSRCDDGKARDVAWLEITRDRAGGKR